MRGAPPRTWRLGCPPAHLVAGSSRNREVSPAPAAEALTNVAKHAHAGHAEVTARIQDGTLMVQVRDDGVGGAWPDGSGLVGLADRLAALDGRLRIDSPPDGGTLLAATIPLPA
jgi:glucose-6-phosphate-specific signal transduction histidine kinase